jgi:hypothetical protein
MLKWQQKRVAVPFSIMYSAFLFLNVQLQKGLHIACSSYTLIAMVKDYTQNISELLRKVTIRRVELESRTFFYNGEKQLMPAEISLIQVYHKKLW